MKVESRGVLSLKSGGTHNKKPRSYPGLVFIYYIRARPSIIILYVIYIYFLATEPALTNAYIFSAVSRTLSSPGNSGIVTVLTI